MNAEDSGIASHACGKIGAASEPMAASDAPAATPCDRVAAALRHAPARLAALDPRMFQLSVQGSLLLIGALAYDFALILPQVLLAFAGALAAQALWLHAKGLQHKGYLSALVTGFGISLLVRADSLWVHPLLAALAISSKFVLRYRFDAQRPDAGSSHLFNPANLGAFIAAYALPGAWLSPGQWGQAAALAVLFIALGSGVAWRAGRGDASWAFLGTFIALVALRVWWLGANPALVWHQLQNGALLLFAFFMISDPLTTPREPRLRIVYAAAVALLAFGWQYALFKPNGPIVALFAASFAVPWINRWSARRGARLGFDWSNARGHSRSPLPR